MSRVTDRTSTKAQSHVLAQRATAGAKAKARKALGKSFRRPPIPPTSSLLDNPPTP